MVGTASVAVPSASHAEGARTPFRSLADRVLDEWLTDDPSLGRSAGLHAYDGKIARYSAVAIKARLARLEGTRQQLRALDRGTLSADEALDLALLQKQAELLLFQGAEREDFRHRPQFYEDLFSVNSYLDRDYAPLVERVERLVEHEEAALAEVPHIRENLLSPMSRPVVETAAKIYRGYAEYLRTDVVREVGTAGSPALRTRFARANEALAKAAEDLAETLVRVELPRSDQSHVIGKAAYRRLLEVQEGLHLSLDEFKAMGEADLAENRRSFDELWSRHPHLRRPSEDAVFGEAQRLTDAARRFVLERHIVSVLSDEVAVVKESPPFMRWNAAFLDAPGPFETRPLRAYYYISRPDPTWSKQDQEAYIPPLAILLATTVHEVYPGHFLQGQWLRQAPTRIQKLLTSYSFVEGWAHYSEQLMVESGFGRTDPETRLGQLSDALLRNCRFLVSIGVHTEGMTLAQAEDRFIRDCHQDKATAREQAVRATFDPGYFAYTLGKLQILALRREAEAQLGPRFSLVRFHDALLAHGAPPVALIRERVLHDLAGQR